MAVDLICKKVSEQSGTQTEPEVKEESDPVITCKNCMGLVTKPDFRMQVEQQFSHTFANPHGHVFEIGCFSRADGCIESSVPSDDFSWFNGYVWSIGLCRNCKIQLGWIFLATKMDRPQKFYGLILDQLVFP
ncbi:MAG: cereblon family protein [Desulfobacterales bacterium]|nr:cereblon family protein [Desulfobacterales bacterium]